MRLLLTPTLALEGTDDTDGDVEVEEVPIAPPVADEPYHGTVRALGDILREDYEHRARTGDASRIKRSLRGIRRNLRTDAGVLAQIVEAAIPHIDRDGAEWLIEELGIFKEV